MEHVSHIRIIGRIRVMTFIDSICLEFRIINIRLAVTLAEFTTLIIVHEKQIPIRRDQHRTVRQTSFPISPDG